MKPWQRVELTWTSRHWGGRSIWEDSPEGFPQTPRYKWWRWHDTYGNEDAKWANVVDNAAVTLNL